MSLHASLKAAKLTRSQARKRSVREFLQRLMIQNLGFTQFDKSVFGIATALGRDGTASGGLMLNMLR